MGFGLNSGELLHSTNPVTADKGCLLIPKRPTVYSRSNSRVQGHKRVGVKAVHREVTEVAGTYTLREQSERYTGDLGSESEALRPENTICWKESAGVTEA